MSLITACAILCSLKFTFFGDSILILTNWKMIKTVTLNDLHIVFDMYMTVDIDYCFLVFNI